jgi:hypothetical protein
MSRFTTPLRRRFLLAAGSIALAVPLSASAVTFNISFGGESVHGSGKITTVSRQVPHFSGVALSVPGEAQVRIGATEGISIETDDNLQPLIETVVEDGVLQVRPARHNVELHTRTLRITVSAREIDHLSVGGSGSITAGDLRGHKIGLSVGGSGSIAVGSVQGDELAVSVGGSGDIKAAGGAVSKVRVSLGGSGDIDLARVKAAEARVSTAGSGDTTLWVTNQLNVSAAGSGDVTYYGDPSVSKSSVGSSEVRRAGSAPR